jgi:hypothetical protein
LQPDDPDPLVLGLDDWPESEADDRANDAPTSPPPTGSAPAPTSAASAAPAPASSRTQSRPKSSALSRRDKGGGELKRHVEVNRSDLAEREEKRQKIQADTQIEVEFIATGCYGLGVRFLHTISDTKLERNCQMTELELK